MKSEFEDSVDQSMIGVNRVPGGNRRQFFGQAGLLASGLGLIGATGPVNLAFGQSDEPDDCVPPVPTGPAVPFRADPSAPMRYRKSAWDPTYDVGKLKAGYAAMRQLSVTDPTDPRGWIQQANVHCWYCGGGLNGQAGEEIHGSWWFFAWHRCYLYFHERILGKLIGDATLALPYWDWQNTAHRTLPPPFVTPNDSSNPLFDAQRGATPADVIPDFIFARFDQYMNQTNTNLFMGTNAASVTSSGGQIENGPHGAVHIWTGDPTMESAVQDMGILATAAQDPVFFCHHSNIDKCWYDWINSSTSHLNPTSTSWLTHRWTFYDENKQFTSISVADVLTPEDSLRYTYRPVGTAVMSSPVATFDIAPAPENFSLAAGPVTKSTAVPDALRSHVANLAPMAANARKKSVVIHIDGIEAPVGATGTVMVFVNLPNANSKTALDSSNYLGYFTLLTSASTQSKAKNVEKRHLKHVVFDVTGDIAKLIENNPQISVTLVPTTGKREHPKDFKVTFQKVYITVEE